MEAVASTSFGFNEVLDKIVELKNVYEVNSTLMKNREDEIESLRSELEVHKQALAATQSKLDESNKMLIHEKKLRSKFKGLFRDTQIQLEMAKREIEDKSAEVTEMEDYILRIHEFGTMNENIRHGSVESVGSGSSDDGSENSEILNEVYMSPSAVESKLTLSPIPEENADDVPDYYDEM